MRMTRHLFFALLLVLLVAGTAHAADGHETNWTDLAFRVANIIIVAAILWKFAAKPIVGFFTKRKSDIAEDFSVLEERRLTAEKDLAAVEQRIASLEAERVAILAEYRAQGEQLKSEIIAKAEKSATQIAEQARRTAENEVALAMKAIRHQVAGEIIAAAEQQLASRLSEEDHLKLIDASLNKVVLN